MLCKNCYLNFLFIVIAYSLCFLVLKNGSVFAQMSDSPVNVAAALIVKLSVFEKNISGKVNDVTIYVVAAPEIAGELKKGIGKNIGKAILKNVVEGDSLPEKKPDIIYVEDVSKIEETIKYSRANKVLSTTRIPDLVVKGITLGIGVGKDGKPKILLNLSASAEENLDWNPAIMKIAKTLK